MRNSLLKASIRLAGRVAPSALRFVTYRNPLQRGRWTIYSALAEDEKCRDWLAALENPTETRHAFKIFTTPHDLVSDWIKVHGQHESSTEKFILDHLGEGTTFLDIGSNSGYFSLLAVITGKARKAIAFEPQRHVADLLRQSIAYNKVEDSIRVEQAALSNVAGTMTMRLCPGNSGHAQLTESSPSDDSEKVPVIVLDNWAVDNSVQNVSVCKIDTEGAEVQVLQGMSGLLKRERPAIVIEIMEENLAAFGARPADIYDFMKANGYVDVSTKYTFKGDSNGYFWPAE